MMDGEVEANEEVIIARAPARVKVWVAALASILALYVPQTPLVLKILNGHLFFKFLPGLPGWWPTFFLIEHFGSGLPFTFRSWMWSWLFSAWTTIWLGGLMWLSFKGRRIFWVAIVISTGMSGLFITLLYLNIV